MAEVSRQVVTFVHIRSPNFDCCSPLTTYVSTTALRRSNVFCATRLSSRPSSSVIPSYIDRFCSFPSHSRSLCCSGVSALNCLTPLSPATILFITGIICMCALNSKQALHEQNTEIRDVRAPQGNYAAWRQHTEVVPTLLTCTDYTARIYKKKQKRYHAHSILDVLESTGNAHEDSSTTAQKTLLISTVQRRAQYRKKQTTCENRG